MSISELLNSRIKDIKSYRMQVLIVKAKVKKTELYNTVVYMDLYATTQLLETELTCVVLKNIQKATKNYLFLLTQLVADFQKISLPISLRPSDHDFNFLTVSELHFANAFHFHLPNFPVRKLQE